MVHAGVGRDDVAGEGEGHVGEHYVDGRDAAEALKCKGALSAHVSKLGGRGGWKGVGGCCKGGKSGQLTSAHSLFVRVLRVASLVSDEGCHLVLSA